MEALLHLMLIVDSDGKCYLQGQTVGYLLAQMTDTSEITMTGIKRGGGEEEMNNDGMEG